MEEFFYFPLIVNILSIHFLTKNSMKTPTWYERNATMMKILLCGFLLLILLIPASMIRGLITERANRANDAKQEIYSKWGGTQTLTGPIISVPYFAPNTQFTSGPAETKYFHILPDTLTIETKLVPEIRTRGIFEGIVYTSESTLSADFLKIAALVPTDKKVNWNKAIVTIGIADTRGIVGDIVGTWNDVDSSWEPGLATDDVVNTGIHMTQPLNPTIAQKFTMKLTLRGGEMMRFLPVGKTTNIQVVSTWKSPSFDGAFLP